MNADLRRSRIPAIDNNRSGGGDKSDTQGLLEDVGREQEATVAANQTAKRGDQNTSGADIIKQQQPAKHHHRNQHRHHSSSNRHRRQSLTEQPQQQQHYQAHSSSCHQDRASANQLNKPPLVPASTGTPCSTTITAETARATTTTTTTTNDRKRDVRSCSQQEILATHQPHQADSGVVVVVATTSNQGDQSNHHLASTTTPIDSSPPLSHCSRCAATNSSVSSIACSTAIAPTNNNSKTTSYAINDQQDTASEHSNNSFLFWKFISNLPKSITQRSKSNSSNTLTPEVAGYLASKRQCNQTIAVSMTATATAAGKTTTTSSSSNLDKDESSEGYHHHHQQQQQHRLNQQLYEHDDSSEAKKDLQQSARTMTVASSNTSDLAAAPGKCVAAQQLSQDGQRLIKIIAPPKLPQSQQQQHVATAAQTGVGVDEAQVLPVAQNKTQQQQVKLSIATITTTTATNTRSSASSLSSCILSESATSEVRLKWGKKMDFLLSIIGFAVDLANIWRFPYLVYKNGGGVFLIPYVTMLIFGGIPLFFLELCLGQFVKKGPITVWNKICPSMKGVGYCSILISWYVSFYYNVLIAWSVYFIYRSLLSFGEKMPWEDCDNSWNSKGTCVSISHLKNLCSTRNESLEACRKDLFAAVNVTSPASEFFVKELSQIDQSAGLNDMGYLRPELVLCTMIVYLLHYFSLFRGLETSGKVVWVTATAPYMILSILLIRGLFLPGASMGIEYYLSPKLEKLADPTVWIDAAGQVFYSIGVGFGVHLTYASFNSHNNNCYRDCLMTSAVNAATSVYSGLVVFVYLGYMAKNLGIEIDKVASEGYSLVFEVYPEALTTLPFARFWSILFFIMLLTLGIDSAMGGLEAVITGLEDEFRFAKRLSRGQLTALVIVSSFIPALISCTQGGAYTLFWFDIYSAGVSLLFSALFETIGVVYCYGLSKFILNIESMIGKKPHVFYIMCWKYISPIFLGVVIFMSIYTASTPVYRGYTFPLWSVILGWCLAFSSVSAVPIVAGWYWYTHRGKQLMTSERTTKKHGGSGSAASSRRESKKSPNHKAVSVTCSASGAGCGAQSHGGLSMTTTTILSAPSEKRHQHQATCDSVSCRTGEDML